MSNFEREGRCQGTDLENYASTDALSKFRADLAHMKEQRTVIRGELGHDAKVTSLDAVAKLPTATIEDCVDLSKWQTIDTRTNKVLPLPTNQPRRYVATATAEKWPNGWMVTDYVPDGARSC